MYGLDGIFANNVKKTVHGVSNQQRVIFKRWIAKTYCGKRILTKTDSVLLVEGVAIHAISCKNCQKTKAFAVAKQGFTQKVIKWPKGLIVLKNKWK